MPDPIKYETEVLSRPYPNLSYSESRYSRTPILTYFRADDPFMGNFDPAHFADTNLSQAISSGFKPRLSFDEISELLRMKDPHDVPPGPGVIRVNMEPGRIERELTTGKTDAGANETFGKVLRHESSHAMLWPYLQQIVSGTQLAPEQERDMRKFFSGFGDKNYQFPSTPYGRQWMFSEAMAWPFTGGMGDTRGQLGITASALQQVPPDVRDRYLSMMTLEDAARLANPPLSYWDKNRAQWAGALAAAPFGKIVK